jgi:hypothetical protein
LESIAYIRCEGNDNKWRFFAQMKYWITVVSKTGTKLTTQCLNPFWDSQMLHSTVSKNSSSKFFEFFSFIFILFRCPAVASNFFKQYQRFLKICNKWNQSYKFQIFFILIYLFRIILLNPFCTPEPGLVAWSMLVGLLDLLLVEKQPGTQVPQRVPAYYPPQGGWGRGAKRQTRRHKNILLPACHPTSTKSTPQPTCHQLADNNAAVNQELLQPRHLRTPPKALLCHLRTLPSTLLTTSQPHQEYFAHWRWRTPCGTNVIFGKDPAGGYKLLHQVERLLQQPTGGLLACPFINTIQLARNLKINIKKSCGWFQD